MQSFDIVTLRVFRTIVEVGSIAQAARIEHITASAVSRRVAELERDLGVTLLQRTSSGVSPTAAGAIFAQHCQQLLGSFVEIRRDLKQFADGSKGELRIRAVKSAIGGDLPFAIKGFQKAHPDVGVFMQESYSHECMVALREDAADLVFVADTVDWTGFEAVTVAADPIWVVAEKNHPLFAKADDLGRIAFADVLAYEVISLHEGGTMDELIENAARDAGETLSHRYRVARFDSLRRVAEAGLGVGLLRRSAVEPYLASFAIGGAPLADDWGARCLIAVYPKNADSNPIIARFLQFYRPQGAKAGHTEL